MPRRPRVAIIGGGVVGLSTAEVFAPHAETTVFSARFPRDRKTMATTSQVAAAFWYPFHAGDNPRNEQWAEESFNYFAELADKDHPAVRFENGIEYFQAGYDEAVLQRDFWWKRLPGTRVHALRPEEVPARIDRLPSDGGIGFRIPVIDMPVYLHWLVDELEAKNVLLVEREVDAVDFEELLLGFDIVINCGGLGAKQIVQSPEEDFRAGLGYLAIVPERIVSTLYFVHRGPPRISSLEQQPIYIVPRAHETVLGGTLYERPSAYETSPSEPVDPSRIGIDMPAPDPNEGAQIVHRCKELVPSLAAAIDAHELRHVVGARPFRGPGNARGVRFEVLRRPDGKIEAHNYGHGGAGVSLGHGSALDLLNECRRQGYV